VAFVVTVPFAKVMLPHLDIYMPLVATVMFMNDVMTASLLVAQFSVVRSRALLLLANGYLFTALVVAVYGLVWPGAFHPTGLFGAGPQTRPWLYLAWHAGLPMSVIGYALLKSKEPKTLPVAQASVRTFTLASIACTVLIVCGVTWFVTRFEDILPVLVTPIIQTSELSHVVYGPVLFASFAAFVLQWRRRQRSVLDLWLSVVTLAWLLGSITLNAIGGRYDVAWYAITAFSIVSATLVLLILFSESAVLHAQLAIAEVALRTLNETLEHRVQAETRERLQIWNVSQDLLVIAGLDGKALSVNPAWTATLGWSEADLLGQSSQWLLHPDDRDSTRAELDHLAQGHKMWRFENRLRAQDGSYRWISWKAAPDSGRIYSMGRDITEHKWAEDARARAEGELQQARTALAHRQRISMLGEVAAALAHEIRQRLPRRRSMPESARARSATSASMWKRHAKPPRGWSKTRPGPTTSSSAPPRCTRRTPRASMSISMR